MLRDPVCPLCDEPLDESGTCTACGFNAEDLEPLDPEDFRRVYAGDSAAQAEGYALEVSR